MKLIEENHLLDIEKPCLKCIYSYKIYAYEDEILMCGKTYFKKRSCLKARKSKFCGPKMKKFESRIK